MLWLETLRRVMEGNFEDATPEERNKAVRELVQMAGVASAAVAFQPIPLVDIALISPIQIALVQAIGRVYGHRLDVRSVMEMLSTFGASMVAQGVIMQAAKMLPLPGLGWAVAASMAYALTYAVGEVSDFYFRNGRGVDDAELKSMFDRVYKEKKAEKERKHAGNVSLKDKLEQLKEAHASGLLSEEEFNRKKEDLLRDF